jgi:cell wall-associated NlpC family hydrolase
MRATVVIAGLVLALAACSTTRPALQPVLHAPPDAKATVAVRNPRTMIVASATAMLGQPYRYGGAAPGGFDCSGLVVYATNHAGFHLPRTALQQLRAGSAIPRTELQAGDLVFMHLARKELHVGIAIDADRFVHAPATGRHVRIDSLNAPPYVHGFLTAVRIVDDATAPAAPVEPAASAIQYPLTALPAK